MAEIRRRRGLWLISDEVYDGMVREGRRLSPRALPCMTERTVTIGSLSKSHAMTGSRLGWALAPEGLVRLRDDPARNACYGLSGSIQDAGLWALTEGDVFEAELAAVFRRRRDLAVAALAGAGAASLSPPQGAMYVMPDIRPTGLSGIEFADRLLDAERIAVMPGESVGRAAAGNARVAPTARDDALAEALARIAAFADRLAQERAT